MVACIGSAAKDNVDEFSDVDEKEGVLLLVLDVSHLMHHTITIHQCMKSQLV